MIICDGPYGVTNFEWNKINDIQTYNYNLLVEFHRVLKKGGAVYLFGRHDAVDFIDYRPLFKLQNKIMWYTPSRLSQGKKRYTNNYIMIAYFTKGAPKTFNLDDIRIEQMVELTHRLRCENVPSVKTKYVKTKYNPKGKNPGDVWGDIKQLTYKSKEIVDKELYVIQKPINLIERIVKASSNMGDIVLDPFAGVGTTWVVCKKLNRNFIGFEINERYIKIAEKRVLTEYNTK